MPKRAIAAIITTALALALLFSFKTPASSATALGLPGPAALAPSTSAVAPGTSAAPAAPAAPLTIATKGSGTFTGVAVQDPYGQVQVQVTMTGGKITDVTALQLPSQGRSGFISQSVAPILQGEAISAQSASIDTVSGATYTSQAYAQSLQSALDQAHA